METFTKLSSIIFPRSNPEWCEYRAFITIITDDFLGIDNIPGPISGI
jgi:hypothetical protein